MSPSPQAVPTGAARVVGVVRVVGVLGGLAALLAAPGCIQRKMVITSDPPGAVVWVNDQELGRTPLEAGFTFYGVYDVRLRKEGFEPVATTRRARAPLYEYPGPDLVAEAFPLPIRSVVRWHFDLAPLEPAGPAEIAAVVERARELREQLPPAQPHSEPRP